MPRLFVAINLPGAVRRDVWEAATPLRSAEFPVRWVAPESMHLTLKFLGNVADERLATVERALEQAIGDAREFELPLGGFGAFPTPANARVVWVGCGDVPALELLQDRLERQLEGVGFPIEGRPFRPHLTLGRVKKGSDQRALAGLGDVLDQLPYETDVPVPSIDLMESHLSARGARYSLRRSLPLVFTG